MAVGAVVVAALAAPHDAGLDALLGDAGARALREALLARARRWAAAVAPGACYEATSLAAAAAALHDHEGPVLAVAPDVPGLDDALARDALADVGAGCDVAVGVAHDGRPFVVAVRSVELLHDLSLEGDLLRVLAQRGLRFGLLRSERRLAGAADVRALALDPLAPPELAPLLRARRA